MFSGLAVAASMLATSVALEEPMGGGSAPGSARNRPSGSKPVAGGGVRERERRLAKMKKAAAKAAARERAREALQRQYPAETF
jgi:hypothetical protein